MSKGKVVELTPKFAPQLGAAFRDGLTAKVEQMIVSIKADPATSFELRALVPMVAPMIRKGLQKLGDLEAYKLYLELREFMAQIES